MFTINLRYTTGCTFSSEVIEKHLEIKWDSIEKAKEAMTHLKEHWIFAKNQNGRDEERKKLSLEKALKTTWYSSDCPDMHYYLKDNDGNLEEVWASYLGYFEELHEATIVWVGDNDEDPFSINFDMLNWKTC